MKKRANILIVSGVFLPEPLTSARMNYDLAKDLAKDCDVTVLRPVPSRPIGNKYGSGRELDQIDAFEIVTLKSYTSPESRIMGRIKESISFSMACLSYLRQNKKKYDLVYNDAWQLCGLYIIAKYCKRRNIPYVVPIQDVYPESLLTHLKSNNIVNKLIFSILLPIDKYYQKNAVVVRTISEEMADYLSKTRHIHRSQYQVVYNWQDSPQSHFVETYNSKIVFAYFGSVNEHANVELIIQSFIALNQQNSVLWIYGAGNRLDECKKLVDRTHVNNVIFGKFTPENMYDLQSKADVLVLALPSGNGTLAFPSKLSSYLFSGKPILASVDNGCAVDRMIALNKCGKSVGPDDVTCLTEGFLFFLKMDYSERCAMGKRGKDFADTFLTKEKNLGKVVDMIKNSIKDE